MTILIVSNFKFNQLQAVTGAWDLKKLRCKHSLFNSHPRLTKVCSFQCKANVPKDPEISFFPPSQILDELVYIYVHVVSITDF